MRPFTYLADRHRLGPLGRYVWFSRQVPGWTRGQEAIRLAQVSSSLPENAVVVEIGSFLGCSAILLAGGRKTSGSGEVHCVDPFDGSGDAFSVPIYSRSGPPCRNRFASASKKTSVEPGCGLGCVCTLPTPTKQSTTGPAPLTCFFSMAITSTDVALATYLAWSRLLKVGGILAVHNSRPGYRCDTHDGSVRLVEERVHPPIYGEIELAGSTTFARKLADDQL